MGRKRKRKTLGTIWEVPDALWKRVEPLLKKAYPPKRTGQPRADFRRVLNGTIYRMRTGCQWNQLPEKFGDDSTVHRWFQRWCADGIFRKLWAVLVAERDELGGVDWEWQAADGAMGKARFGGRKSAPIRPTGENPAPREASSSRAVEAPWGR
jgi:putative transposase